MTVLSKVSSTVPISNSVTYSCAFKNNWSATNHPVQYPGNAHWSPPVIVAHNDGYSMWAPGDLASPGAETVAETGSPADIVSEIQAAQGENYVGDFVQGVVSFNSEMQMQTFTDITLTPWFNSMSSITMIAPSPDWFSGFYNVMPIDESSMVWLESFEIATYPWDAGTETGEGFSPDNPAEDPHVPIRQFTTENVPDSGILLNADRTEILPMAMWTCTLVANECLDNAAVCESLTTNRRELKGKKGKSSKSGKKSKKSKGKDCKTRVNGQRLSTWCPSACGMCGDKN